MARYEISNEVRPLDRLITGFASSCGYEIQTVFNDLLRFIIHGFSPGAPPMCRLQCRMGNRYSASC